MTESTIESSAEAVGVIEEVLIRVLHVNDEAGFLKAAKQILEMQGAFQVDTASAVEEAIGKMKENTYDAIICDYVMPEKGGLEFLKELRQKGNTIPFVIFTGKGREEVAFEAFMDFLNAVDAGIQAARQRIKAVKVGWDPDKTKWEKAEGSKGPYERSEDVNNPEFKAMLKDLASHGGRLTRNDYFYWVFKNGTTVGRKRRS